MIQQKCCCTTRVCCQLRHNMVQRPGAKTINVFRACLGAQLTICVQKSRNFVLFSTVSLKFVLSRVCVFLYSLGPRSLTQQAQNKLAAAHTKMVSIIIPNIIYKDSKTNIWVRDHLQWEKNEVVLGRSHQPPQWTSRVIMWSHKTRKDDKEDQPSGGETTWTNTGPT